MTPEAHIADLALLKSAARAAGRLAMRYFGQAHDNWTKTGGSPVTEADIAVDTMLRETLMAARPGYGWLSEETDDDPALRVQKRIFVVDPIDGTRGFMAGDKRWSISLAIIENSRPITAVLCAPALDLTYCAETGHGAWRVGESRSDEKLAVSRRTALSGSHIAGPRNWLRSRAFSTLSVSTADYVPSLALRFAMVADGAFDAAFARPNAHDWDLAACDLLVHEAGGILSELDGKPPQYNCPGFRHGALVAANRTMRRSLVEAVAAAGEERRMARMRK
ncbi:MAG: 3'(2'),5'-bisphosphate nucleotidase CysQ [Hyphomicrobiales bacterium]|nr:3'(2'),5'-bisphosphate nucleotidase CysQ [Hyphomicrobiales bacterium]